MKSSHSVPASDPDSPFWVSYFGKRPRSQLARCLHATLGCTILGAFIPILILGGFTVLGWLISGAGEFDRNLDLHWLKERLPLPVIGCAAVFGCAGWVTFLPRSRFPFAGSLSIIFGMSMVCWFVMMGVSDPDRPVKGVEPQAARLDGVLRLIMPPIVSAALLTPVCLARSLRLAAPPK